MAINPYTVTYYEVSCDACGKMLVVEHILWQSKAAAVAGARAAGRGPGRWLDLDLWRWRWPGGVCGVPGEERDGD